MVHKISNESNAFHKLLEKKGRKRIYLSSDETVTISKHKTVVVHGDLVYIYGDGNSVEGLIKLDNIIAVFL